MGNDVEEDFHLIPRHGPIIISHNGGHTGILVIIIRQKRHPQKSVGSNHEQQHAILVAFSLPSKQYRGSAKCAMSLLMHHQTKGKILLGLYQ